MIALHNIVKSYPLPRGKKVVLDDVNITFRPGENMGILGLNGAGKSTLMRIIGGAELPDRSYHREHHPHVAECARA